MYIRSILQSKLNSWLNNALWIRQGIQKLLRKTWEMEMVKRTKYHQILLFFRDNQLIKPFCWFGDLELISKFEKINLNYWPDFGVFVEFSFYLSFPEYTINKLTYFSKRSNWICVFYSLLNFPQNKCWMLLVCKTNLRTLLEYVKHTHVCHQTKLEHTNKIHTW